MSGEPELDIAAALRATDGAHESFETVEEEESPFRRASDEERALVNSLNSACRVARLHSLQNRIAQGALNDFAEKLTAFLAKPRVKEIMLVHVEGRVIIRGATIKQRRRGRSWVNDWLDLMASLGIGAMVFHGEWDLQASTALLESFGAVRGKTPDASREQIAALVAEKIHEPAQLIVLSLEEAAEYAEEHVGADLPPTQQAIFYYARLVALAEGSLAAIRMGRSPDFQVRHVRSTLMRILENIRTGVFEVRLLALTAIPHERREPEASHLTNTAILSIAMGRLLALRRGYLIDLGFAACYHDLGRALLGKEALFQEGGRELDRSDLPSLWGVGCSLRARSFGSGSLIRVAVAQEVERVSRPNASSAGLRQPHVFSKIVSVASAYDRLANGTPWEPPLGAHEALVRIEADRSFPADVVKLLRSILGPRPRGTALQLPSGETCAVIDGGARRGGVAVARVFQLASGAPATRLVVKEVPPDEGKVLPFAEVQLDWPRVLLK